MTEGVSDMGMMESARVYAATPAGITVSAGNMNGMLSGAAWALMNGLHSRTEERRGDETMHECQGVALLALHDVTRRLPLTPARKLNPWVSLAEFPWLVAGRSDIAWLLPYLPRAAQFSDDGKRWRAGYGPRLRQWVGPLGVVDQLQGVSDVLRGDPATRRAVVTLWDPSSDLGTPSRDVPCTNWLHFQIVDGKLDLTVTMRSNDLIWGLSGVNVVNFTLMQEVVARTLMIEPGTYRHVASNLHVYPRHVDMAKRLPYGRDIYPALHTEPIRMHGDIAAFTHACMEALYRVEFRRHRAMEPLQPPAWQQWIDEWAFFMDLHPHAMAGVQDATWWVDVLKVVRNDAWRLAAATWLAMRNPDQHGPVLSDVMSGWQGRDAYMEETETEVASATR
jgi:thymidylate synthase